MWLSPSSGVHNTHVQTIYLRYSKETNGNMVCGVMDTYDIHPPHLILHTFVRAPVRNII